MSVFLNRSTAVAIISSLIILTCSTSANACACCNTYKVVNVKANDQLAVRSGPGPEHKSIAWLHHNESCIIKTSECKALWCKIKFGSINGWVYTHYLAKVPLK